MSKKNIYVSGLPRSGSTLVCQLLGMHPKIYSSGHSSPLADSVEIIRNRVGENTFFLSQMDIDPEGHYNRFKKSIQGFMDGWLGDSDLPFVVDKSRSWLPLVETLKELDPDFKMVVCIRNLVDIFASIEKKHRENILIPFPDGMTSNNIMARASLLFGPGGVVGGPLSAIINAQDIPDANIMDNIYFIAYEALMENTVNVMNQVYEFVGAGNFDVDINNMPVKPHESDSYYRMKYPHKTYSKIEPSFHKIKEVSPRVVSEIINGNKWFYEQFYPGILKDFESNK